MHKYKIIKASDGVESLCIELENGAIWWIPNATANTDYQRFKTEINADEAQLEDADGNLMTAEEAKAFVATLP